MYTAQSSVAGCVACKFACSDSSCTAASLQCTTNARVQLSPADWLSNPGGCSLHRLSLSSCLQFVVDWLINARHPDSAPCDIKNPVTSPLTCARDRVTWLHWHRLIGHDDWSSYSSVSSRQPGRRPPIQRLRASQTTRSAGTGLRRRRRQGVERRK